MPRRRTRPSIGPRNVGGRRTLALVAVTGANINAMTKTGVTPLIYAASEGWDDCVPLLLTAGADPQLKTNKGRTALQAALMRAAKAGAEDKPRFDKAVKQLQQVDGKAPAAPAAASGGGLFGAALAPAAAASDGGLFGAAPAPVAAAAGGGLFGAALAPAAAASGGGLFGATVAKTTQAQSPVESERKAAEPALSQIVTLPSSRHPPSKGQGPTSGKTPYRASRP